MRSPILAWAKCVVLVSGALLVGCGPDFDPPSELHSLRVLAVHKDVPYAQPGQTVNLQMLWEDASLKAIQADGTARPIQIAWSGPCFDPLGDLYYNCFSQPSVASGFTAGETTSFVMEKDVITPRPPPNAAYGIAYVFFAACAGKLVPMTPSAQTAFPFGCQDLTTGAWLGSDDFVAGYTSVYSFASFSNQNPLIEGVELNGQTLTSGVCQDDACLAVGGSSIPDAIDCMDPANSARCVPTCTDDGGSKCKGYSIRPVVNQIPQNQEEDEVTAKLLGRVVGEQMWIDYYTDAGGFKSPVRLLNDATNGWNADYGTDFYAPKDAKPFRVFTVVHDNRGGAAWAGVTLQAQ